MEKCNGELDCDGAWLCCALLKFISLLLCLGGFGYRLDVNVTIDSVDTLMCVPILSCGNRRLNQV